MKKTKKNQNILMVAASEYDANLYYATRFIAPDAFIYVVNTDYNINLPPTMSLSDARKEIQSV